MVSVEIVQASEGATKSSLNDPPTSPRISFSAEFLDESNFISINPHSQKEKDQQQEREKPRNAADFEFLSNNGSTQNMLTADELFFEGKLLPFWQIQHSEKLSKLNLRSKDADNRELEEELEQEGIIVNKNKNNNHNSNSNNISHISKEEPRVWFVDDDPSPRPPKCTVLWKELLRLKKQRAASSLSPSSSSSSTSSSSSAMADMVNNSNNNNNNTEEGKDGSGNKDSSKHVKKVKKGLERTRSANIRIRPMINVPICAQVKSSALPPLFPLKKGRILER